MPFIKDVIKFTFATNEILSRRGFRIHLKQLSDSTCGGTFQSINAEIFSPEFPSNYPNNLHCLYSINRYSSDVCQIQFQLSKFDIEASPSCTKDYFQLGRQGRLCGERQAHEIRKSSLH